MNHAPVEVLSALPGVDDEVVRVILDQRSRPGGISDLLSLTGALSAPAAIRLLDSYPELSRVATSTPDAWLISATARAPSSEQQVTVELKLVRGEGRGIPVRRRDW